MYKLLIAVLLVTGCAQTALPGPEEDKTPAPVAEVDADKPDMGHRAPKEPTCGLYHQGCCCLANGTQACGCADGLVCGAGPDGTCDFAD